MQKTVPRSKMPWRDASTEFDFLTSERNRAERMNKMMGTLSGWNCTECLNRGYFVSVNDQGSLISRPCRCMGLREAKTAMRKSALPADVLEKATWANWDSCEAWQRKALELAKSFVDRSIRDPGAWFFIGGPPGTGKTKLCSTVFRALIEAGVCEGRPAPMYVSWRDLSRKVKSVRLDDERTERLIKPVLSASVLYLDDLWKAGCSPADVGVAFDIINTRYQNPQLITLVSSEITLDRVIVADEAVGSRIAERCEAFVLDVTGAKNWRLNKGQNSGKQEKPSASG